MHTSANSLWFSLGVCYCLPLTHHVTTTHRSNHKPKTASITYLSHHLSTRGPTLHPPGHIEVVETLLAAGADINEAWEEPEDDGCECGSHLSRIFGLGATGTSLPQPGATPLHLAARGGHTDLVTLLINKDAEVDKEDAITVTPLILACEKGHADVVRAFFKAPRERWPNLNVRDKNCFGSGETPFGIACRNGRTAVVEAMLELAEHIGLDIEAGNCNLASPLYLASQFGHTKVVELLIKAGANIEAQRVSGARPLLIASYYGHLSIVDLLLRAGAEVDAKAGDGSTALWQAVLSHTQHNYVKPALLKRLMDGGADPQLEGCDGVTAVQLAQNHGEEGLLKVLCPQGVAAPVKTG